MIHEIKKKTSYLTWTQSTFDLYKTNATVLDNYQKQKEQKLVRGKEEEKAHKHCYEKIETIIESPSTKESVE